MMNYWLYSQKYQKYQNFKQKIAQKRMKTKNIFFTSISPKTFHFDQKISYFYQQTKAWRDVELGEEYQTGPLYGAVDLNKPTVFIMWQT